MASGDHQDTSQSPKPTGKKAKKLTQKEQSERFIETARELGIADSDKPFTRAIDGIMLPRKDRP